MLFRSTQAISGERKNKENDLWLTGGLKITPLKDWTINVDYTYMIYNSDKNLSYRSGADPAVVEFCRPHAGRAAHCAGAVD